MDRLLIGEVILKLRKERGITQEQLGNFIGVSTAAVSKWESGASYPDITLLPELATFFNVSIDTLLNYRNDLSQEEVMKIYSECEALFSRNDLEVGIEKCKSYVQKYGGSYYLKLRIGFLFNMYSWKLNDEDEQRNLMHYTIELFEDVAQNCTEVEMVETALFQLGALYSTLGENDKAITALEKIHRSQCDPNVILSSIYMENNEFQRAREMLQSKLYMSLNDISFICMGLANSYSKCEKDLSMIEKYYKLSIDIKKAVSSDGDSVLSIWMEYFHLAETYCQFHKKNESIEMLNRMLGELRKDDINKPKKVSAIWCFNELKDGKKTITMNLYENIFKMLEQPVFDIIRDTELFQIILKEIKDLESKSIIQ